MARSDNNLKAVLQDTANAIRAKTGASAPIVPRDFADEIESIQAGGGGEEFVALVEYMKLIKEASVKQATAM